MFTLKDFKVKLVNGEEVKNFVKRHGEFSKVCYDTPKEKAEKVGEHCLESGHLSGSRHLYMVFELKNIPRSTADQLVRHTQGFVTNVQSLRYCNKDGKVSLYASTEIVQNSHTIKAIKDMENSKEQKKSRYKVECLYGRYLLMEKNPVLHQYLVKERQVFENILDNLFKQPESEKIAVRMEEVKEALGYNEAALAYYRT